MGFKHNKTHLGLDWSTGSTIKKRVERKPLSKKIDLQRPNSGFFREAWGGGCVHTAAV